MPSAKGSPAPAPEGVEVRDDGTVRLAWDGHDVILRRPTIEQWLAYLEEGEAADNWKPTGEDGKPRPRQYRDLISPESPYRALYARIVSELAGSEVTAGNLPPWMSDGGLVGDLSRVWLSVPLLRSGTTPRTP